MRLFFLCSSAKVTVAYCFKYFRRTHFLYKLNVECRGNQAVGKFVIFDFSPGFGFVGKQWLHDLLAVHISSSMLQPLGEISLKFHSPCFTYCSRKKWKDPKKQLGAAKRTRKEQMAFEKEKNWVCLLLTQPDITQRKKISTVTKTNCSL